MNDAASNAANNAGATFMNGLEQAWSTFMVFVPKILLFAVILLAGWFVARLVARLVSMVLTKAGFNRLVERGALRQSLEKMGWNASMLVAKLAFYSLALFTLQVAFNVFGSNAVSDMLSRFVTYLPNVFVAAFIVFIASAVAGWVRNLVEATAGAFRFGNILANAAAAAIWIIGIFAALDQLNIAPRIINGLFYCALAVLAGSAVIAIGGGGIAPMRTVWENALGRLRQEAPRIMRTAAGPEHEGAWHPTGEVHEEESRFRR